MKHINNKIIHMQSTKVITDYVFRFPFPLNHLWSKALEHLVGLLFLTFSPHQNTEDKRTKLFGSIKKKSNDNAQDKK